MKARKLFFVMVSLLVIISLTTQAQKSNLTGEWKLNKDKTGQQNGQVFLSKIAISIKSDTLFTTRTYEDGNGQEYPFDENLSLTGKENKIVIYDMPRSAKATWAKSDDAISLDSSTTFNRDGQDVVMVAKETWKVEVGNKSMTINTKFNLPSGEVSATSFFDRIK